MNKLWTYIPEMVYALEEQLREDDQRWGNTWVKRTRGGQEQRTWVTFQGYFDQYFEAGVPIPWLKVIGNAFICWLREQYPEVWKE